MLNSELIAEIRSVLGDTSSIIGGEPDELVSNERILRRLNEAQNRFCDRAWVLVDDTTAATCQITMLLGQSAYNLHKSVLKVKSLKLSDSDIPLSQKNWNQLFPEAAPNTMAPFDVNAASTYSPGRPGAFACDVASKRIIFGRSPDSTTAGLVAQMRVARLPLLPITAEGTPEIAEEYHQSLADWAAGTLLTRTMDNESKNYQRGKDMVAEVELRIENIRKTTQRREMSNPGIVLGEWTH